MRSGAGPLTIMHCIPSLGNGGAERQLSILASAQVSAGSRVHLAYVHDGPHFEMLRASGVRLHRVPAKGNHDFAIVSEIWRLMSSIAADVVQTWLPQMDVIGGSIALTRGTPWVLSERSSASAYTSRLKERVLRRQLGRWADAVVANSEGGSALWSGTLRRGARASIIRNALPLAAIESAQPATAVELGVLPGQPIVIFVGRLSEEKNIDLLLDVAGAVCAISEATFLICGEGPLRSRAEQLIGKSEFGERIKLLGQRRDIWQLMKRADAFISTSTFEGQPNAVLEAMACGCPLVVSDIPAHREFLDDETAAIVPFETDAFARAVLYVLQGSEQIERRRSQAKQRVLELTPANVAAEYERIYGEAILRHNQCAE